MNIKNIGKSERDTQNRIISLFQNQMGYTYLGNWQEEERLQPIEEDLLLTFLTQKQNYSPSLAKKAIDKLVHTASDLSDGLYQANKKVYRLLRYGITVQEEIGQLKETVWLINWSNKSKNDFAIAEEVTVKGKTTKRPDIVLYVNGIALGVLELKRSKVGIEQGIRQNLDNQKQAFIERFFTTMQFVMAGNDSIGLKYGTIETPEKYFLSWKEKADKEFNYIIDKQLSLLCAKERLLTIIHDFTVFDKGTKKLCRPNQFFGITAAQQHVADRAGGILWHTQGSGKSLMMVMLAKWIHENITDSRVLIITDRDELDKQIEGKFIDNEEKIYRTKSGKDLLDKLNHKNHWLICSLIHKFGRQTEATNEDLEKYIAELKKSLSSDFKAKGTIYVFVDECHRTQSGKLHEAMKTILPEALFIGFTGTPLLKKDKQKSIEVFGPYIGNPYKFDEAVKDGVVLDLLYEARDVEQFITDQQSIDDWFDAETKGMNDFAKIELKKKWGTMQKVLGSKSRLEKIVFDIIKDFKIKPRLSSGEGNAMLVSGSIYQACKYYELFKNAGFKECAIITSYEPNLNDIKGEETGEQAPTDKLKQYEVYQRMLNGKKTEDFEEEVKTTFIKEPSKMKLLIVVDKLLTGFDAPSATYLYIDKSMQDHGLFQAICRVNRIHTDDKDYGYIVDYKDLFKSLQKSISDYTALAFENYDANDIKGLLSDRYEKNKERLENALDAVRALCEPVHPKDEPNFIKFFCGNTENKNDLKENEQKRLALYKLTISLIRAYANLANEMHKVGYSKEEAKKVKEEVQYYSDLRETIKVASGDKVDLKRFEPGMRQLMDMYLSAHSSRKISNFENQSLVELIIKVSEPTVSYTGATQKQRESTIAETIENNIRKVIIEETPTNPKYFEKMSELLDNLIEQRKQEAIAYETYLKKIKELAGNIDTSSGAQDYPESLTSKAKRALYDNLDKNEVMALAMDNLIQSTKLDDWRDGGIREKKLMLAIKGLVKDQGKTDELMKIIKAQDEY
jgi:type I restriction enzyme R subunit